MQGLQACLLASQRSLLHNLLAGHLEENALANEAGGELGAIVSEVS